MTNVNKFYDVFGINPGQIREMSTDEYVQWITEEFHAKNNNVDRPGHYVTEGLECIEVMRQVFGDEAVEAFCLLNAFKYIWRSNRKNGVEDIQKANWYTAKYAELVEPREDDV